MLYTAVIQPDVTPSEESGEVALFLLTFIESHTLHINQDENKTLLQKYKFCVWEGFWILKKYFILARTCFYLVFSGHMAKPNPKGNHLLQLSGVLYCCLTRFVCYVCFTSSL